MARAIAGDVESDVAVAGVAIPRGNTCADCSRSKAEVEGEESGGSGNGEGRHFVNSGVLSRDCLGVEDCLKAELRLLVRLGPVLYLRE